MPHSIPLMNERNTEYIRGLQNDLRRRDAVNRIARQFRTSRSRRTAQMDEARRRNARRIIADKYRREYVGYTEPEPEMIPLQRSRSHSDEDCPSGNYPHTPHYRGERSRFEKGQRNVLSEAIERLRRQEFERNDQARRMAAIRLSEEERRRQGFEGNDPARLMAAIRLSEEERRRQAEIVRMVEERLNSLNPEDQYIIRRLRSEDNGIIFPSAPPLTASLAAMGASAPPLTASLAAMGASAPPLTASLAAMGFGGHSASLSDSDDSWHSASSNDSWHSASSGIYGGRRKITKKRKRTKKRKKRS
jgi:hypothetical protein